MSFPTQILLDSLRWGAFAYALFGGLVPLETQSLMQVPALHGDLTNDRLELSPSSLFPSCLKSGLILQYNRNIDFKLSETDQELWTAEPHHCCTDVWVTLFVIFVLNITVELLHEWEQH